MARRQLATARTAQERSQRELADLQLVLRARNGDSAAMDALIRRYTGFVRLKASSYFLAGGDVGRPQPGGADRPLQGGAGLPRRQGDVVPQLRRALHHPPDHHRDQDRDPLQARAAQHVRLVQPDTGGSGRDGECTLGDALPGPGVDDPAVCVISTEELQSLVFCLGTGLSPLESDALRLYLEGNSYEEMAERARLRHEDDRQRAPAREAQGAPAPERPPGPRLTPATIGAPRRSSSAGRATAL